MDSKTNQEVFSPGRMATLRGRHKHKANKLFRRSARRNQADPETLLTQKEREVLVGIASGVLDEEIAEKLNTDIAEVKAHIDEICKKLNAPNRLQAILWAAAHF